MWRNKKCITAVFGLLIFAISYLPFGASAKQSVYDYEGLKDVLESDTAKKVEIAADIPITAPIIIRGSKCIEGKGHLLERGRKDGKVYAGTLFLMMGTRCEWKNVVISGAGEKRYVGSRVFGRLIELRKGVTAFCSGNIWKNNINRHLAVDGGGAVWIRKGASCYMMGGKAICNENVSCGAGFRVDRGGQLIVEKGEIINNTVRGISEISGFEGLGAGIYNEGSVTIQGGSLRKNKVAAYTKNGRTFGGVGGGIYNKGSCIIVGGTVQNNDASVCGSVLYASQGSKVRLGGGVLQTGEEGERKPVYVGGICTLEGKAGVSYVFISHTAEVEVIKGWNREQKVTIEPYAYKKGLLILQGAKGNFELKEKNSYFLCRRGRKYYVGQKQKKQKKRITGGKRKKAKPISQLPVIDCQRRNLVFYENEYVSKRILCYGVTAKDRNGAALPVYVKGKWYKDGWLDTERVRAGNIVYSTKDREKRTNNISIPFRVVKNKKPMVQTVRRYFFQDEMEQINDSEWSRILWEGVKVEDDHEKEAELKKETTVELRKSNKRDNKNYDVKVKVRDQYGHRYYMKEHEKRRYGKGKYRIFSIPITIVKRNGDDGARKSYVEFISPSKDTEVEEMWHFTYQDIKEIQRFMTTRDNPFSKETNQEFYQKYQKFRVGGKVDQNE